MGTGIFVVAQTHLQLEDKGRQGMAKACNLAWCQLRKSNPHPEAPRTIIPSQYLEGQVDLVSRLIIGIIQVTIWAIGVINLLTKSPDPPSNIKPPPLILETLHCCIL